MANKWYGIFENCYDNAQDHTLSKSSLRNKKIHDDIFLVKKEIPGTQ